MLLLPSLLLFASLSPCDGPPSADSIQRALDDTPITWLKAATVQRLGESLLLEVSFKRSPLVLHRTLPAVGSCEALAQAIAVAILTLDITLKDDRESLGLPSCTVELSAQDTLHLMSLAWRPADAMPFDSPGATRVVSLIQWARSGSSAAQARDPNAPPGSRPRIESPHPPASFPRLANACKPRSVVRPVLMHYGAPTESP